MTLQYAQPFVTSLLNFLPFIRKVTGCFTAGSAMCLKMTRSSWASSSTPLTPWCLCSTSSLTRQHTSRTRLLGRWRPIVGWGKEVQTCQQQANKGRDEFASILATAPLRPSARKKWRLSGARWKAGRGRWSPSTSTLTSSLHLQGYLAGPLQEVQHLPCPASWLWRDDQFSRKHPETSKIQTDQPELWDLGTPWGHLQPPGIQGIA